MDKLNIFTNDAMQIKYPDYSHSLLSLSSSVLVHYGIETVHKTLPEFDDLLSENCKNVVVMLFDGMGTAILERHLPPNSFLRRHYIDTISSVFPPTTTAATITVGTGLSPIEHGWLGWSLYFDEIGNNVNVFPNTISGTDGKSAADYNVGCRYIPYKSIYDKINAASDGNVRAFYVSPFSEYRSKSVSEISDTVKKLCAQDGQKYIHTYWHQPDYDMHDLGISDEKITAEIRQINDEVEELCASLTDTLVIVTADHGLIDTEWRLLPDYPDIIECLEKMPSIESRALSFFIKPEMNRKFEEAFEKHFGSCYILLSREQVLSDKMFGHGKPNPRSLGFIGDYLAVATKNISIECTPPSSHSHTMKAAHAGITADEMNVPFIAAVCR